MESRGFSLIEVAVATAIIGLGIVAMIVSTRSGTDINGASREMTQALFLANEIREWTLKLPFSDQDPADKKNPDFHWEEYKVPFEGNLTVLEALFYIQEPVPPRER